MPDIEIRELKRVFKTKVGGKEMALNDPDPAMEPDEVLRHYQGVYPELANAAIVGPDQTAEETRWTFSVNVGVKG